MKVSSFSVFEVFKNVLARTSSDSVLILIFYNIGKWGKLRTAKIMADSWEAIHKSHVLA